MKKLNKTVVLLLLLPVLVSGCISNNYINKTIVLVNDTLSIRCNLNDIEYPKFNGHDCTVVKGTLEVTNISPKDYIYNLNNIILVLDNVNSENIYINSVASVIIKPELIKSGTTKNKRVYWTFTDKNRISPNSSFKLTY